MAKLFNKVRKKLVVEKPSVNRTSNYFKYAIGEIVLVVIGILIALQINNWNEQRKENQKEQAMLKRLEKEFISNKEQLQDKIKYRNRLIKNCKHILNFFNKPENASMDSIVIYSTTISPTTFDPIQNDLVSSGTIEIIKNEKLKQLLVNWSTDVIQLQETEKMYFRYYETTMVPYYNETALQRDVAHAYWNQQPTNLLENIKIKNPIPKKSKLHKKTKNELLTDPKFEGIIAWSLILNKFNNQESETLMKRINQILQVLDTQIKK